MRIERIDNRLWIIGEEPLKSGELISSAEQRDGTYFVKKTNVEGIVYFGFKIKEADSWGNPAGYVWSSRAGAINKVCDVPVIDAYYRAENEYSFTSCGITVEAAIKLVENTEWEVNTTPINEFDDIIYTVVKRS